MADKRSPIAARAAARAAIGRAMTATVIEPVRGKDRDGHRTRPLNRVELLALLAVMANVSEFDRCEGTVSNAQILEMVPGDPRDVRRALKNLADAGVFVRTPGKTGHASAYAFPIPEGGTTPHDEGGVQDPPSGGVPDPEGRGTGPQGEGSQHPTSEVPSKPYEGVLEIAGRLIGHSKPGELERALAPWANDTPALRGQLTALEALGKHYEYPRFLVAALTTPTPARWQSCGQCVNGMVETDTGVTYCSCHPSRAMAAVG